MSDSDFRFLSARFIEHGKTLANFPCHDDKIQIFSLGSGGVMLSRSATELLVRLFSGDGDEVITDRAWLRAQFRRLGISAGETDLLIDHIAPPRPLCVVMPFSGIVGQGE